MRTTVGCMRVNTSVAAKDSKTVLFAYHVLRAY